MKAILIIQARMGSSRLPGKVLLPLGDTIVLDYVVSRSRLINGVSEVIVATSDREQDQSIADWCAINAVTCFRGSEDDVLNRFIQAADPYQPDYIFRVTGDSPFLDYELANLMMMRIRKESADLVVLKGGHVLGSAVELITYRALKYIDANGLETRHREHVTYYAYENPEAFRLTDVTVPEELRHAELRITLDTPEDYRMLKEAAARHANDPLVPTRKVVQFLLRHPEVAYINAHIRQKPVV